MVFLIVGHSTVLCLCPKFSQESVKIFIKVCAVVYFLKVFSGHSFNKLLVICVPHFLRKHQRGPDFQKALRTGEQTTLKFQLPWNYQLLNLDNHCIHFLRLYSVLCLSSSIRSNKCFLLLCICCKKYLIEEILMNV